MAGPAKLHIWLGKLIPTPASTALMGAVDRVEVQQKSQGRSAFQVSFLAQRADVPADDYALLAGPFSPLNPTTRMIIFVELGGRKTVIADGFIIHQQLAPTGGRDGQALITVTGEDVSIKMDLNQVSREYPGLPPNIVAMLLIAKYPELGLLPLVIPPIPPLPPPNPLENVPIQHGTDYEYVSGLATGFGYTFRVQAGPLPLVNTAYWGPDIRIGILPQPPLTVGQANGTNVDDMNFTYNAMTPYTIGGAVLDGIIDKQIPLQTFLLPISPFASRPPIVVQAPNFWRLEQRKFTVGGDTAKAYAKAQAQTLMSQQTVVQASGKLDAFRYGHVLRPYESVTVRGAGNTYDGIYWVQDVTTTIERGGLKQQFVLTRGGLGSLIDSVTPGF